MQKSQPKKFSRDIFSPAKHKGGEALVDRAAGTYRDLGGKVADTLILFQSEGGREANYVHQIGLSPTNIFYTLAPLVDKWFNSLQKAVFHLYELTGYK